MNGEFFEMESQSETMEALELPEGVELMDRPEAAEAQELQKPAAEIRVVVEVVEVTEGLEVDTVSNEVSETKEVTEQSPYSYSEAYIDEYGVYHPEQINGIYKDAMEDPKCQQMAEDLRVWEQQEKEMSCAVQCQRMIIEDLTQVDVSEGELRETGENNNWYTDTRGTYISDVGKLAEHYGLEYEQYEKMHMEELVQASEAGDNLIVAVDAALLSYPYLEKLSTPNHAVEVIGFDFSDAENPKVILNDPGREDGRGSAYPLSVFINAACETNMETGEQTLHSVTAIRQKEEEL